MPSREVMVKRLAATLLPLRQQGVLFRFLSSIADQQETGSTLIAAWESACQDATQKLHLERNRAITRLLHAYAFPGVVDAVTPDQEVADAAKEELKFKT